MLISNLPPCLHRLADPCSGRHCGPNHDRTWRAKNSGAACERRPKRDNDITYTGKKTRHKDEGSRRNEIHTGLNGPANSRKLSTSEATTMAIDGAVVNCFTWDCNTWNFNLNFVKNIAI